MTRCPEGHFFDPARHLTCPWCALPADAGGPERPAAIPPGAASHLPPPPPFLDDKPRASGVPPVPGFTGGETRPMSAPPPLPRSDAATVPTPPAARPATPASSSDKATVRFGAAANPGVKDGPVVGWLVCLDGPDRGRDYRLHAEKNFIGRAAYMDIIIEGDNTVSRDKHAIVIFDPKKKAFWALPGDSAGLVYLNGELVHSPAAMKAHDVIEVGKTRLVLIPFCGDRYDWSNDAAPAEA